MCADISSDWDPNKPSGSSLISDGDDLLRQHWTSLESSWNEEHFFNQSGSDTSAGIHQMGSARGYMAPSSALSASNSNSSGRLFWATDTAQLHVLGASSTSEVARGVTEGARASTQSAGAGVQDTWTTVEFEDEERDQGDFFDSSATTGLFAVPSGGAGLYQMNATIPLVDSIVTGPDIRILTDGGSFATASANGDQLLNLSLVKELSDNSTVEVQINSTDASSVVTYDVGSAFDLTRIGNR